MVHVQKLHCFLRVFEGNLQLLLESHLVQIWHEEVVLLRWRRTLKRWLDLGRRVQAFLSRELRKVRVLGLNWLLNLDWHLVLGV